MMDAHPAASIFPLMSEQEYAGLLEDIRANGLREPIVVDSKTKTILDGRNRYRACRESETVPEFEWYDGNDPTGYVVSLNLHRRHLNESQRAMVAARIATLPHGVRSDRVDASNDASTQTEAAKLLNVSRPTVQRARVVLERGTPEQIAAVDAGQKAVSAIFNDIKREKAEQETELPPPAPDSGIIVEPGQWWTLGRHRLYCGDTSGEEFIGRLSSCAFAFADPPYNAGKADWDKDFIWHHDYLADYATVVAVTPGTADLVTFGTKSTMPYQWCMAAWIDNGMTRGKLGYANWIPVALFGTGNLYRNAQDIIRLSISVSETGDTIHPTRKPTPLMTRLIELFTDEGDTVIDPFLGSGTTLLVSDKLGRTCIGGEMNPVYCAEIISRWQTQANAIAEVQG